MKPISQWSNDEIIQWVRSFDAVYESGAHISNEDANLYIDLVDELLGRGFDLEGNSYSTLYSKAVKLGNAVAKLERAIIDALPKWMQRWIE